MSSQAEPLMVGENDATSKNAIYLRFRAKGKHYHAQIPVLKRLPFPSIAIISLLVIINILVWIAVGIVLVSLDERILSLVSTAVLAYSLGLRHALDADHISAIDLMTRRLIATGQRPVTVGTFFSLGHSTIVVITSIVVASTAAAVSSRFGAFSRVGGIIGSSVSATFLIVLGIMNVFILYKLITQLRKIINSPANSPEPEFQIEGGGCLFHVLKRMFKLIDRPWKMYPLGVLFGLGFDTSSEIALLGISAISASQGTSFWLILLFPVLFTAGMCLLDTTDGALMMALYTSTRLAKDNIAVLYYQSVLTGVTVLVAVVIGVIQFLGMLQGAADLTGGFWDGVEVASDNYDIIGGAICGSFVVFGVISAILYRPWRRRVDAKRNALVGPSDESDLETRDNNTEGIHGEPELVQEGPSTQHVHADRKGDCVV
ncbi:NicO-domain-containing protein [Aureobasidium pullulans]|nr:NicO-domain-containing protein [Aureobasidium pullulans]THW40324.1 NicO-domain-containing protein [Aureobasidium pullulans]THX97940.1 NicO-domain-containing protein [Aureobasidium pullulans]THY07234.1 NicO-domain-containing protein [Aureobasidium pullulans]THY49725.1 NicO-domain-containing protein [Aureobasidium pullulans]